MKVEEAVIIRIKDLCFSNQITPNMLAYTSAISPSTLKNILYGKSSNVGVITIAKICDGLNITLQDFFSDDIFSDLDQIIQ